MGIGVAVIGLGWWGRELARAAGHVPDLDLVAGVSPDAGERTSFVQDFGCAAGPVFADALADPGVEAVLIATPHSLHAEQVAAAAQAGKHVFVEKPFTLTAASGRAAAAACRDAGVVLAVGHNRRLSAAATRLHSLLEEGAFGTVLHLEGHFSSPSALGYRPDMWRAQRAEAPGGGMASMGLHIVDTMQWLFGPVRRVSCLARRAAAPVDIDDATTALLEFDSGLTATLTSLFATTLDAWLRVCTTNGIFTASDDFTRLTHTAMDGAVEDLPLEPVDTVVEELSRFAAAVGGEGRVAVTPEEAIANVAAMEALAASAAENGVWREVERRTPFTPT